MCSSTGDVLLDYKETDGDKLRTETPEVSTLMESLTDKTTEISSQIELGMYEIVEFSSLNKSQVGETAKKV